MWRSISLKERVAENMNWYKRFSPIANIQTYAAELMMINYVMVSTFDAVK
jgi:hypothetical protein